MIKILSILLCTIFLSGCVVTGNKTITLNNGSTTVYNNLISSKDICQSSDGVMEVKEAVGKTFELPKGYKILLKKSYKNKFLQEEYNILSIGQDGSRPLTSTSTDITDMMPAKPIEMVFVNNKNVVQYFVILCNHTLLLTDGEWPNNVTEDPNRSIQLKDLDNNGTNEILLETFKVYLADSEISLLTFSYNQNDNKFTTAEKIFHSSFKDDYQIVDYKGRNYVIEAVSGTGLCRLCATPYTINAYEFTNNNYIKVKSTNTKKEFEQGKEALDYNINFIKNRLLNN